MRSSVPSFAAADSILLSPGLASPSQLRLLRTATAFPSPLSSATRALPLPPLRAALFLGTTPVPLLPLLPPSRTALLLASVPASPFSFSASPPPPTQQQQQQLQAGAPEAHKARAMAASASTAVAAPVEVLVKAASNDPEKLGDCPFSQRVLITLEEKGIPYSYRVVNTADKPQWFLDANPEGKVPVIKTGSGWLADSDAIVAAIEAEFPDSKPLKAPGDKESIGSGLFGAFARFLKGSGSEEDLLKELQLLDDALAASGGPFVAGEEYTAVDASLAPKLYHLETALQEYEGWKIPEKYPHVIKYIQAVQSRASFQKTAAPRDVVLAGWARALGK